MKVLAITPSTHTGEYQYSKYLINGLNRDQVELKLLNNPFFKVPNVKILLGSFIINKMIKELDIIHNMDNLAPFLFKSNNIKRIMTVMDIAPVIFPEIHGKVMNFDFQKLLPSMINNSHAIIVPSLSTKNDLINYFGTDKNKIHVIHLGIDKSIFNPKFTNEEVMQKYGIKNKYLLYVGTDNPRKNLKNLIIAFANIYNELPHNLVLVGPINRRKLDNFVKNSHSINCNKKEIMSRIITPGYVDFDDLPFIYSAANALVFPSLYEGFGFTPLEAMACNTPVITSNNSSLKEVVGNAGLYIKDPLDPTEISDSILKLIENDGLSLKLRDLGLSQSDKFPWQKTADKTYDLYKKLHNL